MEQMAFLVLIIASFTVLLLAAFGVTLGIRYFFFSPPPPPIPDGLRFVTKTEMVTAVEAIKEDIHDRLNQMADYSHKTAHDHANLLHTFGLKLERLLAIKELEALRRKNAENGGREKEEEK